MNHFKTRQIKPNGPSDSGRVRQFKLPGEKIKITQISTFCPEVIGPGSTHIYLIETDVILLVDAGIPTSLVKEIFFRWRNQDPPPGIKNLPDDHCSQEIISGLKSVGFSIRDIDALIITHGHPDHYLNGGFIMEQGCSHVFAHLFDLPEITSPWGNIRNWIQNRKIMTSLGMPFPFFLIDKTVGDLNVDSLGLSFEVDNPIIKTGAIKLNGSEIGGIKIGHFPGHTPGSIGLIIGSGESRALVCGDVLLKPITPNPSDLLAYLRTLQELKKIENIALVLPAHGNIFQDMFSRIEFIERHHKKRLKYTYKACHEPRSVWEIALMPKYFDTYVNPKQYNPIAGSEALAHVELLKMAEGLYRTDIKDGIHYFQNSGEPFETVYERVLALVKDRKISTIMKY